MFFIRVQGLRKFPIKTDYIVICNLDQSEIRIFATLHLNYMIERADSKTVNHKRINVLDYSLKN